MKKYIFLLFVLAACSDNDPVSTAPYGDELHYAGTCYFQNDSGQVSETIPAYLDLVYSNPYYKGTFKSGDVSDTLSLTLGENSVGVLMFDGNVWSNGDTTQFVAAEGLGAAQIENAYYLPGKWRIFKLHRQ